MPSRLAVVNVTVVSKACVLADINALRPTTIRLPASAFLPGTKAVALAVMSAPEMNVRGGQVLAAKEKTSKRVTEAHVG
jgi:hypothetical protein